MEKLSKALPYILHSECVLFIGAGISEMAGCYDWDTVVQNLLKHPVLEDEKIRTDLRNSVLDHEERIENESNQIHPRSQRQ